MKDIFISYSNTDLKTAKKLCAYLESEGKSCWIAPRDISPGTEYGEEIIRGIEECKAFIVIFSDASNQSQHVLREVERAVTKRVPIIVYKISNAQPTKSLEYFLLTYQWLDATGHDDKFDLLRASVEQISSGAASEISDPKDAQNRPSFFARLARNKIALILSVIAVGVIAIAVNLRYFCNVAQNTGGKLSLQTSDKTSDSVVGKSASSGETKASSYPISSVSALRSRASASSVASVANTVSTAGHASHKHLKKSEAAPSSSTPCVTAPASKILSGSILQLGHYYAPGYTASNGDSYISWIVLNYDKASGNALILSKNILDMKPYDVAESRTFEQDKAGRAYEPDKISTYSDCLMTEFKGNSDWESSDIRSWLNADGSYVSYKGAPPVSSGDDDDANGYNTQKGFLSDFTLKEKAMIVKRKNLTPVNVLKQGNLTGTKLFQFAHNSISANWNFSGVFSKATTDKVFLLSIDEVKTYLYNKKLSIYAKPTVSAIDSDKSTWYCAYKDAGKSNYLWALRTPDGAKSYSICVVGTGDNQDYDITSKDVSAAGLGIRPAMVIHLKNAKIKGDGSSTNPYHIN